MMANSNTKKISNDFLFMFFYGIFIAIAITIILVYYNKNIGIILLYSITVIALFINGHFKITSKYFTKIIREIWFVATLDLCAVIIFLIIGMMIK